MASLSSSTSSHSARAEGEPGSAHPRCGSTQNGDTPPCRPSAYTRQFPAERLKEIFRNRDRHAADIAFHVFRVAEMGWQASEPDKSLPYTVPTYYGLRTMHDVFERTAWHAAHHTRQLMLILETYGIAPDKPLTGDDLAGLPAPDEVWDR